MQKEKKNTTPFKKYQRLFFILTIVLGTLFLTLILWYFFIRKTSTITVKGTINQITDSATCSTVNLNYPFFAYDNSDNKALKITAVFDDNKISSIALVYTLWYSDPKLVITSDNINENSMGASSQKDGLSSKPLNAHFSKTTDALVMNLYAKSTEITEASKKYLLLSDLTGEYTKDAIIQAYTDQGFNCE